MLEETGMEGNPGEEKDLRGGDVWGRAALWADGAKQSLRLNAQSCCSFYGGKDFCCSFDIERCLGTN